MTRFMSKLNICIFLILSFNLPAAESAAGELFAAGATFPYPLYNKMFEIYSRQNNTRIHYEAVGSGRGLEKLIGKSVDFAGTDAFMTEAELKRAGEAVIHIPTCIGGVVLIYNLPSNPVLKFTPDVLAEIFLGKINKWSDSRLKSVNPGLRLSDSPITVVHRSDASGTTHIFSDYLSKVSLEWKEKVGLGKSLSWPVGLGARGNPGVAGLVKQIPGSIGYVELIYALGNEMTVGAIRNKSLNFITPSMESVSLAANVSLPEDTNVSLTDTVSSQGYPISGFTWLALYREQGYGGKSRGRAQDLAKLLWWMIHEGQRYARSLHYAPLPGEALHKAERLLRSLTYEGKPLLF
jgi:phosphate transport system substrate-binding protein